MGVEESKEGTVYRWSLSRSLGLDCRGYHALGLQVDLHAQPEIRVDILLNAQSNASFWMHPRVGMILLTIRTTPWQ